MAKVENNASIQFQSCPKCGARQGENCRTGSGRRLHFRQTHASRELGNTTPGGPLTVPRQYVHAIKVGLNVLLERCKENGNHPGAMLAQAALNALFAGAPEPVVAEGKAK